MENKIEQNMEKEPLVHIVDDDLAVLDSMGLLLKSIGIKFAPYTNAPALLAAIEKNDYPCGCIVLDIRMPVMSGIECQAKLNDMGCTLPIIFVTGHGDVPLAVEAMKKGAVEFIEKPFREQTLIEAVQNAILQNQTQSQRARQIDDVQRKLALLTEREHQVLEAIVDGKANKVIAADLHLSQRTVEIHRAHVMEKMAATSLAHLIKMVLDSDGDKN